MIDCKYQVSTGPTYPELAPDPCMNAAVTHQAFFMSKVEKGAMGQTGLSSLRRSRPSIQVCIEVDDGYRSINFVQRAKDGQNDGMVAAQAVGT